MTAYEYLHTDGLHAEVFMCVDLNTLTNFLNERNIEFKSKNIKEIEIGVMSPLALSDSVSTIYGSLIDGELCC